MNAIVRTREDAENHGFAAYNRCDHLCVDLPNGSSTITVRTSDGKLLTLGFNPYEENGVPQSVDIKYHNSGATFKNGKEDVPTMVAFGTSCGSRIFGTTLKDEKPCTCVVVLLNKANG